MAAVRLSAQLQWLSARDSGPIPVIEPPDFNYRLGALEDDLGAFPADYALEMGRVIHDVDALGASDEQLDAIWDAYRGQKPKQIRAAVLQAFAVVRDEGRWGDVVDRQRVHRTVEVVGLSAPDVIGATTTASFSFTKKSSHGLKVTIGVASVGVARTYSFEDELTLECAPGEGKVASLYLPLDRVTQLYRPPGSGEWFPRVRFEPVALDPDAPNIGARADAIMPTDLMEGLRGGGTPVGSGSASFRNTITTTRGLSISMELGPKLKDDAGSLTASATIEGEVKIAVAYQLPANEAFQLFWLAPIAGACVAKA